jgi:hypothetical protein
VSLAVIILTAIGREAKGIDFIKSDEEMEAKAIAALQPAINE